MSIAVLGHVEARSPETVNPKVSTGAIEVRAREIRLLNDAKTPPFPIADESPVSEDTRLKYRYLDLRRSRMQQNLALRHRVTMEVRKYFDEQGFLEIETPMLAKSTPEGARDYLVPSRVHPGEFYALPQSPQIFKQILMISGLDRYFQIVKCFRDEDLRADRQPEFTQIDLEMSFATEDLVFSTIEPLMERLMALIGREAPRPFLRMPYAEAIARYGSDKPDLRCGMEISDLSAAFAESPFAVVPRRDRVRRGGPRIRRAGRRALLAPRAGRGRRTGQAARRGRSGLGARRRKAPCRARRSRPRARTPSAARSRSRRRGQAICSSWRRASTSRRPSCSGRCGCSWRAARICSTRRQFAFLWVVDFPMFEWVEEEQRHEFMHHPFTSPLESDAGLLETDPGRARARAYDLVLNGSEIAGGSIRIHDQALQRLIFKLLQISDEEAKTRFGFFLEALEYGTPPHGGIALGLDRVVAILCGESSIREVIAFPKTAQAVDLMADAPSTVSAEAVARAASQAERMRPLGSRQM